jgi:hypothetical protein
VFDRAGGRLLRVPMTTISKDAKLVTFINVFTVEPANQQLGFRVPRMELGFTSWHPGRGSHRSCAFLPTRRPTCALASKRANVPRPVR